MRTVDLFSGCGGMSLGFQRAGFSVVGAFDNWEPAVRVYRANFKHPIEQLDLGSPGAVEKVRLRRPDVIIGGPPCQDFSSAANNDRGGQRATMVYSFAEIIAELSPKAFVLENVPRARLSVPFREAKRLLKQAGYGLSETILDASHCNVPQKRTRLFLVGFLGARDGFLQTIIEARQTEKPLTMREYFGASLPFEHFFRVPTNYGRRGIFSVDEPSPVIRAIDRPLPSGYKGHPGDSVPLSKEIRGLTVEERAMVQTFPKDFLLEGPKTHLNTMIGNAVPVEMARLVATSLKEYMDGSLPD